MDWEIEFDKRFVMDTDNGTGPEFLFRVNEDGSVSIARLEDVQTFIQMAMLAYTVRIAELEAELAAEQDKRKEAELDRDVYLSEKLTASGLAKARADRIDELGEGVRFYRQQLAAERTARREAEKLLHKEIADLCRAQQIRDVAFDGVLRRADEAEAREAAMREALEPFARFAAFVAADYELSGADGPNPNDCVASYMAGGGSDYIWMHQLLGAREVLAQPSPAAERTKGLVDATTRWAEARREYLGNPQKTVKDFGKASDDLDAAV